MVGGLEEMGLQVEVEDAIGDAHLSTELRRLDRERGVWGVVMHGSSTSRVVVACVVAEVRRRVRRRVFQIRAMSMRQGYRGRGLAMQAMQRVQMRIGGDRDGSAGAGRGYKQGLQPGSQLEVLHVD